jgi:hypothetical protein
MEGWEFSRPMTMIRGKVQANVITRCDVGGDGVRWMCGWKGV